MLHRRTPRMDSTRTRQTLALACALCLGVGGFVAGRFAHPDPAQAEPAPAVTAENPAAAARGLPSFSPIVAAAAPAVVHVRTVSVVDASDTQGNGMFGDDDDNNNPF